MRIVLPKSLCEIEPTYGPLFYLAGPIQGGDDWQATCSKEIRKHISSFYTAIPCRYGKDHALTPFVMGGEAGYFTRQLFWESYYMDQAATLGCLIFWLPRESRTHPRIDGNPYAMDTRRELDEWRGWMANDERLRVVIGADSGFPGLDEIRRNFSEALGKSFPIYPTLHATVVAAFAKVR